MSFFASGNETFTSSIRETLNLDPIVQKFVDSIKGAKPLYTLSPTQARDALASIQNSVKPVLPFGIKIIDTTMNNVSVRIITQGKDHLEKYSPIILYIHGGGWVLGDANTHNNLIQQLVAKTGFSLVFVKYSKSPEVHFPVAINEIGAVLEYINTKIKPT